MKKAANLILFLALSVGVMANPLTLRLNLSNGQVYNFRTETNQTITQTVQGMQQVTQQNQLVEFKMEVLDRDAVGNFVTNIVYTRFAAKIVAAGQELSFDSDIDKTSQMPQFGAFAAMIGKSMKATYSPLGDVVSVEGVEQLFEEILNSVSGGNEMVKLQMKAMMGDNFSADAMKQMVKAGLFNYPEKAVAINDTWSSSESVKNMVTLNVMTSYTLKEANASEATIAHTATLTTPPGSKMTVMGTEMDVAMFGTLEGTSQVDLSNGMSKSSLAKQNINGSITASLGGQTMNIPMTIVTDIKVTLL